MFLYVLCTAGEFVWNAGGVVPATCYLRLISRCVLFFEDFIFLNTIDGEEEDEIKENIFWSSAKLFAPLKLLMSLRL